MLKQYQRLIAGIYTYSSMFCTARAVLVLCPLADLLVE